MTSLLSTLEKKKLVKSMTHVAKNMRRASQFYLKLCLFFYSFHEHLSIYHFGTSFLHIYFCIFAVNRWVLLLKPIYPSIFHTCFIPVILRSLLDSIPAAVGGAGMGSCTHFSKTIAKWNNFVFKENHFLEVYVIICCIHTHHRKILDQGFMH